MNVKRILLFLTSFSLWLSSSVYSNDLVLITSSESIQTSFTKYELRKIFLGFTIQKNGEIIIPYRNQSTEKINNAFYQHIMFMSERNYNRRVLSLGFKKGNRNITTYEDNTLLLNSLRTNANTISYIWKDDIPDTNEFKIIQVIWRANE